MRWSRYTASSVIAPSTSHVLQDLNQALLHLIPVYESAVPTAKAPDYNVVNLPAIRPHLVQPILLAGVEPQILQTHGNVSSSCFHWFQATLQQCMTSLAQEETFTIEDWFQGRELNPVICKDFLKPYLQLLRKWYRSD